MQRILLFLVFFGLYAGSVQAQPLAYDWTQHFPDGLLDAQGKPATVEALHGKLVGLYSSAHWCPPCRTFSPQLVAFRDNHVKDFEVVFISSDKSEPEQFAYMKELNMNWFTLKYQSTPAILIKARYGIKSIPTLIVLAPNGETITTEGRKEIMVTPETCLATWKKKPT